MVLSLGRRPPPAHQTPPQARPLDLRVRRPRRLHGPPIFRPILPTTQERGVGNTPRPTRDYGVGGGALPPPTRQLGINCRLSFDPYCLGWGEEDERRLDEEVDTLLEVRKTLLKL